MGGGASSLTTSMEELLTTTYMIGRAIAAISCPGMYRIYDFHSPRAPKIKNAAPSFAMFNPFAQDSDDEEEDAVNAVQPDPQDYEHMFNVNVGDDVVYIEDPLAANDAGWTPLHTCCMSYMTVPAGLKLIEETVRRGGDLDGVTLSGPGSFNKGWSPLHMACAYGVEPLTERLIAEGADTNCRNCFGYTPLLEACHRGFVNIVGYLLKAEGGRRVNLAYIPSEEDCMASPFVSSPAQAALGEASRSGYPRIVQALLDAGAPCNQQNSIGWTPLHEACFYNRTEVVKALLLAGADAAIRTNSGALPHHLAGLQSIRSMLAEMGGPSAVPAEGDTVDMVAILAELTIAETTIVAGSDGSFEVIRRNEGSHQGYAQAQAQTRRIQSSQPQIQDATHSTPGKKTSGKDRDGAGSKESQSPAVDLHSGPALGVLPALKPSPTKTGGEASLTGTTKKKKKKNAPEVPTNIPAQYLCALSHKPMTEPVKSTYGHVFEKSSIERWFASQGKICPFTGGPLSEVDLTPLPELGQEIRGWLLSSAQNAEVETKESDRDKSREAQQRGKDLGSKDDDALYEF